MPVLVRVGFLSVLFTLSAAAVAAQVPTPPAGAEYAASIRGSVYYWIECTHAWGRLKSGNVIFFDSADQAEESGYRPSKQAGCGRHKDVQPNSLSRRWSACQVERVIDGDTVVCARGRRVRLLLIDAPEMDQSSFGDSAQIALANLLPEGVRAYLELDVQERDRYGRLLAYVYTPDNTMVNEVMARRGYAVASVYPPNVRYVERIRDAVASAREDSVGLWRGSAFQCLPAEHRRGQCR